MTQKREVTLPVFSLDERERLGFNVGSRPARLSGLRLELQQLKSKKVFHNYGHASYGICLSVGTARKVVEIFLRDQGLKNPEASTKSQEASPSKLKPDAPEELKNLEKLIQKAGIIPGEFPEIAVMGAGINGLMTTKTLADLGFKVAIFAENFPRKQLMYGDDKKKGVTQVAPGFLMASESPEISSLGPMNEYCQQTFRFARETMRTGAYRGFTKNDCYFLSDKELKHDEVLPYPEEPSELVRVRFGAGDPVDALRVSVIMLESQLFLEDIVAELKAKNVRFVPKKFASLADVESLEQGIVFNCLALGSGPIFGDKDVYPIKGGIVYFNRPKNADYSVSVTFKGKELHAYPKHTCVGLGRIYRPNEPENIEEDHKILEELVAEWREFWHDLTTPSPKL